MRFSLHLPSGRSRARGAVAATTAVLLFVAAPAHAAPPPNDEPENATQVVELPFSQTQDTTEATRGDGDPDACAEHGHSVWFKLTLPFGGTVEADTFASDYDTVLAVYVGAPDVFLDVACNDNYGDTRQSRVQWRAEPRVTYYIMAAGIGDEAGTLDFDLHPAPAPVELVLSYDPTEWVNIVSGRALITGTVECSKPEDSVYVNIEVTQRRGDRKIVGEGATVVECDGEGRWLIDVSAKDDFRWGRVAIEGYAYATRRGERAERSDTALLVPCTRIGTLDDDVLRGTPGRDQVCGLDGDDKLIGRAGNDTLRGALGNDILEGFAGDDVLFGGPGADRLFGGDGNDKLDGREGDDHLDGGGGKDACDGGPGRNREVSC